MFRQIQSFCIILHRAQASRSETMSAFSWSVLLGGGEGEGTGGGEKGFKKKKGGTSEGGVV